MRTNYRLWWHDTVRFAQHNYRLLLLVCVYFAGVAVGVHLFSVENTTLYAQLHRMLENLHTVGSFSVALSELAVSCTLPLLLLLVLGLSGLSVCGIPVSLFAIVLYGVSTGLTEAYIYSAGPTGIAVTVLLLLPRTVVSCIALVIFAAESLRMSALFGQQVLPSGGSGALWADFKLYGLRFLLCILLVIVSGLLDIGCRLLFGGLTAQL